MTRGWPVMKCASAIASERADKHTIFKRKMKLVSLCERSIAERIIINHIYVFNVFAE